MKPAASGLRIGLAWGGLAYASFSFSDAFIKLLGGRVPPFQLMLMGAMLGLLAVPLIRRPGEKWRHILQPQRPGIWWLRMASGAINTIGAIWAFERLSMPEAFALIFLMPIFVTLLSMVFLGEHVGWRRWLAILLGFVGVLIVLRPGFRVLNLGHAGAILAGLGGAISVVLVRKAGNSEHRITLFTNTLVGSILVGAAVTLFKWQPVVVPELAQVAGYGLLSALGSLGLMMATLKAPVNRVAPIQYSQMLWAVLLGWWWFDEGVDRMTWVGIGIILVAGLFTLLREEHVTGWWHRMRALP